jgi:tRNA uridine 5-carbamoylmethylation protein Kti12
MSDPCRIQPCLVMTRGLPGSGKTTFARKWVAGDRAYRARVNRDDFRMMLDDGVFVDDVTEPRITAARDGAVLALLRHGYSVICDDTNLTPERAGEFEALATRAGVVLRVADFTHVPLATCLERNAARTGLGHVPEAWIRKMHARYIEPPVLPGSE